MTFPTREHVWSALSCIQFVKDLLFRVSGLSQNYIFRYSVSMQFIFHAFGLSKVYFQWLVMVWSWLFTDVDLVKVFQSIGFHQYEFSNKPAIVWSALFCIRFVKSWFLGNPVSPKTIFSCSWWVAIQFSCVRFVQSLFILPCDGSKYIIYLLQLIFNEFDVIIMNFPTREHVWSALSCIQFVKDLLFRVSGLSQNYIFRYSVSMQFIFHAFGLSKVYF